MSRVPRFRSGELITEAKLRALTDTVDKLLGWSGCDVDFDSDGGPTIRPTPSLALFELGPEWKLGFGSSSGTSSGNYPYLDYPLNYPYCDGCRLVYYLNDGAVYEAHQFLREETLWYINSLPEPSRVDVLSSPDPIWPNKFMEGDWVWAIYNTTGGRWEILDQSYSHILLATAPATGIPARSGATMRAGLCQMQMELLISDVEREIFPVYKLDGDPWKEKVFNPLPDRVLGNSRITVALTRGGTWVVLGGSAGGAIGGTIRFRVVSLSPFLGQTSAFCLAVLADVLDVSCGMTDVAIGDQVLIWDPSACMFNIPMPLLIGSIGTATRMQGLVGSGTGTGSSSYAGSTSGVPGISECLNSLSYVGTGTGTGFDQLITDCWWLVQTLCCTEDIYY